MPFACSINMCPLCFSSIFILLYCIWIRPVHCIDTKTTNLTSRSVTRPAAPWDVAKKRGIRRWDYLQRAQQALVNLSESETRSWKMASRSMPIKLGDRSDYCKKNGSVLELNPEACGFFFDETNYYFGHKAMPDTSEHSGVGIRNLHEYRSKHRHL